MKTSIRIMHNHVEKSPVLLPGFSFKGVPARTSRNKLSGGAKSCTYAPIQSDRVIGGTIVSSDGLH